MTQNITFSADKSLIEAARERARAEHTTLNEQFRLWLETYAREQKLREFDALSDSLRGKVRIGRKLSRAEMNER
jgi:hypothetical protein